jgi:hypothetical protein
VRLQINRSVDLPANISVVNASGKVYKNVVIKGQEPGHLHLSIRDWPAGIYLITAEQGNKKAITKLIIN